MVLATEKGKKTKMTRDTQVPAKNQMMLEEVVGVGIRNKETTAVARGAVQARNSTLLLLETTERRPAIVPTQIVRTLKTNMVKAVIFKPWLFLLPNFRS